MYTDTHVALPGNSFSMWIPFIFVFFYCFYFLLSVFCKQIINTTDRHGIKSILAILCNGQSLLEGQLKLFFGAPLGEF